MSSIKTFKDFISENKKESKKGVIPAPIHFKHHKKKQKKSSNIPAPIHFKHHNKDKKNLQETFYKHPWISSTEDANDHLGDDSEEISNTLASHRTSEFSDHEIHSIKKYTEDSSEINDRLLKGYKLNPDHEKIKSGLESAIKRNPIKAPTHLYSGVNFDPRDHIDHDKRTLHSPSFISVTHDPETAYSFAQNHHKSGKITKHIMHIHAMSGDPIVHVNDMSKHPGEHESIINAGVNLNYIGSELHQGPTSKHFNVHVHHFAIKK
jgi:hypothetical protein